MSGVYPHFNVSYSHDELVEHFLLTPADLQLVLACRGEANRCGMALLLKALANSRGGAAAARECCPQWLFPGHPPRHRRGDSSRRPSPHG